IDERRRFHDPDDDTCRLNSFGRDWAHLSGRERAGRVILHFFNPTLSTVDSNRQGGFRYAVAETRDRLGAGQTRLTRSTVQFTFWQYKPGPQKQRRWSRDPETRRRYLNPDSNEVAGSCPKPQRNFMASQSVVFKFW